MIAVSVHGYSTYIDRGCRCEVCKAANAEYRRRNRAAHAARRFEADIDGITYLVHPDAPHGTRHGYDNYMCRCPECRRTHRDARRAHRGPS